MVAVDTNVVVRLIVRDNERQAVAAERVVQQGAWLSALGVAETVWVLSTAYDFGPSQLARAIEMLLENPQLIIEQAGAVERALASFRRRPRLRFTDCLMRELARQAAVLPLATFDRDLAKLEDVDLITS